MHFFRLRQALAFVVLFGLAHPVLAQGPVILGGDDLTDHGSISGTTLLDGWFYIRKALENIAPAVTRPGNDGSVAVLGSTDSTATCCNAGAAYHFAVPQAATTEPSLSGVVTFHEGVAGINAFFADLASGAQNPAIIVTAGNGASNDIDPSEGVEITANAGAISSFVNSGGGLLSHGSGTDAYGWLTALIPTATFPGGCDVSTLMLTPLGQIAFPALTNSDIQAGPCHNHFLDHGLPVLARDAFGASGRDIIIGGVIVLPGDITMTPAVDFNPPGTMHTVTASVVDDFGMPLAGELVTFEVTAGPNVATTGMELTDVAGNATFTYTSDGTIGLDQIQASFVDATGTTVVSSARKYWDLDCNTNGIPDTCDLDCAANGGFCIQDFAGCGLGNDIDGDGVPDECQDCPPLAASEVPRLGTPPNPNALLPGTTGPPVINTTWMPIVDHTSFAPGAVLDFLNLALIPANIDLAPIGTLLGSFPGILLVTTTPGTPFSVPIPDTCDLAGRMISAQALSLTPGPIFELTNALDTQIGTF